MAPSNDRSLPPTSTRASGTSRFAALIYYWVTHQYPSAGYSVIAVDGVAPTAETIGARSYPYTADVWIVTRADLAKGSLAHQLRDWMLSPDGQKAVARSGYVPIIR